MQSLHITPSVSDIPIRLSPEELENPILVLNHFCTYYDLSDARTKLEEWLVLALGADAPELENHRQRSSLLFFSQQLQSLLEANYVLFKSIQSIAKETDKTISEKKKANRPALKKRPK